MADLKYYDVVLRPVITEKSMNMMADKKYTFYVNPQATKTQVKDAVEKLFAGTQGRFRQHHESGRQEAPPRHGGRPHREAEKSDRDALCRQRRHRDLRRTVSSFPYTAYPAP